MIENYLQWKYNCKTYFQSKNNFYFKSDFKIYKSTIYELEKDILWRREETKIIFDLLSPFSRNIDKIIGKRESYK